jgi:ABC-type lipoprotein release transport system permease subunit
MALPLGDSALASLQHEGVPTDVQTLALTALLLTRTAVTGSLVPALRAARIDPAQTLR